MKEETERRLLRRLGLQRVDPAALTIVRMARGRGFTYLDDQGLLIRDGTVRTRLAALAIPPAWKDVRIDADARAHLQAIGRDDAGRLQYIYHADWVLVREVNKINRLATFGRALPRIRATVEHELAVRPIERATIIAAAVRLIDRAVLRAGYETYAGTEGGRGAATLLRRHVTVDGDTIALAFPGKGGRWVRKTVDDPLLAPVIALLADQRGARLFKEGTGTGARAIVADEINSCLRDIGRAEVTVKDFRTFHASARAIELLAPITPARSQRARNRQIAEVAGDVAMMLQNTPTVARSSYIHPIVIEAFESDALDRRLLCPKPRKGLTLPETALMRLLQEFAL